MCMITYLPGGIPVPVYAIENAGWINDDGHGWAIAAKTGLMVTHKAMALDDALDTFYTARRAFPDAPALFHSRWATHGIKDTRNCHPFWVGKSRDTVVAHNGIMPRCFHPTGKDNRSDTAVFAQEWLPYQSPTGRWTTKERGRIGDLIGMSNKLVILSVSKEFKKPRGFLVNGSAGNWHDGAWFSNHDWEGRSWYATGYGLTPVNGSKGTTVREAFNDENECPFCKAIGTVDWANNVCTCCLTCLDCQVNVNDCLCYSSSSIKRQWETAQEEHVRLSDSGEDKLGKALELVKDQSVNGVGWPE